MTVIDAELGKKLVCPSCAVKFYDLQKEPATCPKCGNIFSAEPILPSKEDKPPATETEASEEATETKDEAALPEADETEVVSIEDLVEGDDIDVEDEDDDEMAAIKDVDLGDGDKVDDTPDEDDDTFLEIDESDPSSVTDLVGAKSTGDDE